jgi:DNA-binding MarR family transcriptional regulator
VAKRKPGTADPAESPGFLLWRATNRWQRHLRAALHDTGLTHVQLALLTAARELAAAGAPVTQVALAAHASTDVMMTSQVVRALERRGLLARDAHPADRRARLVTLTAEGARVAERAAALAREADREFFGVLGRREAKFVKRLRRLLAPSSS